MDIYEMIEKGIPVWVINRSATALGKPLLLMLEFPNPNGGRKAQVKLPAIQYPVNLSQRVAPPSAIGMSQDFIDLVNRGVLEVVAPERARQIMSNPEAQAAVKHAFDKLDKRKMRPGGIQAKQPNFKVVNGGSRTSQSTPYVDENQMTDRDFMANFPGKEMQDKLLEMDSVPVQETLRSASTLNARVMQLCADLTSNPELKQEYLLEIKSIDPDSLSADDLGYMIDNLRGFDTIVAYIRGIMAKRVGASAPVAAKSSKAGKAAKARPNAADAIDSALEDE